MLGAPALFLLLLGPATYAKESYEQRYQHALELYFRGERYDEVCDIFTQIAKEKPNYKDVKTYLNQACDSAQEVRRLENQNFEAGERALEQNHYLEAKEALKTAQRESLLLNKPGHLQDIERDLARIQGWETQEGERFQQCEKLFKEEKLAEVRNACQSVVDMGGAHAARAQDLMNSAQAALHKAEAEDAKRQQEERRKAEEEARKSQQKSDDQLAECDNLSNKGYYESAERCYKDVSDMGGANADVATKHMGDIRKRRSDERLKECDDLSKKGSYDSVADCYKQVINMGGSNAVSAANRIEKFQRRILTESEKRHKPEDAGTVLGNILKDSLDSYTNGDYVGAERSLSSYLHYQGPKSTRAYLLRAAARMRRYYLSGEKDERLKQQALEDAQSAKRSGDLATESDLLQLLPPHVRQALGL